MFCQQGWAEGPLPSMPGDPNLSFDSLESKAETLDAQRWEAALDAQRWEAALDAQRWEAALDAQRWEAALDAQRWEAALGAAFTKAFFPRNGEKDSFHERLDSQRWEGWSAVRPPPRCGCVGVRECGSVGVWVFMYTYVCLYMYAYIHTYTYIQEARAWVGYIHLARSSTQVAGKRDNSIRSIR
jgi:hypothetical protein